MPIKEQIENFARRVVERSPGPSELKQLVRRRRPAALRFADDGIVPNNPRLPVLLYRRAVQFRRPYRNAAIVDALFAGNGWGRSWRATVYDYVHYHSQVHEALGIATGTCRLELGGVRGRQFALSAGDIVVLPAGTGHRLLAASRGLLVVGAYPPHGRYDECSDSRDRPEARKRIAKVRKPDADPVHGKTGPLMTLWADA